MNDFFVHFYFAAVFLKPIHNFCKKIEQAILSVSPINAKKNIFLGILLSIWKRMPFVK